MRNIRTSENFVEFLELNNDGQIINSKGFQFGELYFEIKNKKVTFFLNDPSKPFGSMVWSIDIPFELDGVVYEDEDTASSALHNIMNDRFQEQLDQLKEDLAAEEARAQEAEAQLDDKIDDESARAIAAENRLQDQVTELSGTVATFDWRITKNANDISALTDTVNDEITRSVAKDAEHDALISGLTNSLDNEIARAISAETQLHNEIINEQNRAIAKENALDSKIDFEIANRIADVDAEETRALAAESSITANLNSEISRSTEKDAQHDTQISALTVSLDNEINRATTAENSLRSDLNDEIADRISGDTNLQNQLNAEIARAQNAEEGLDDKIDAEITRANSEETRIEGKLDNEITRSTAKDASHDTLISGLTTNLQNEINRATSAENSLRNDLNAEVSRATDAENALDDKIDIEIQNRINAVSGLTERVADDEAAFGAALVDLNNKINAVSGENASQNVQISGLNNSINTEISRATSVENALRSDLNTETSARTAADTAQIERIVALEVGKADKSDLNNYYTKAESDAKYATKDYVSGLTDNFYTKGQTNELLAAKADKTDVIAISGDVIALSTKVDTISGDIITIQEEIDDIDLSNYYTKTESDGKYQLKGDYVTGAQMSAFTYDKQTIDDKIASGGSESKAIVAGRGISVTTGETADTVAFDMPIYDTNSESTYEGYLKAAKSLLVGKSQQYTMDSSTKFAVSQNNGDVHHANDFVVSGDGRIFIDDYTTRGYRGVRDTYCLQDAIKDLQNTASSSVTSGEVESMIDEAVSGKQDTLSAGTGIDITNNVISVTGGSQPVDAYTKAESDAKFATITNFNSHSGNTTIHVTSTEKATWNAKPNVWCGNESEWSQISGSTESGTIYLVY